MKNILMAREYMNVGIMSGFATRIATNGVLIMVKVALNGTINGNGNRNKQLKRLRKKEGLSDRMLRINFYQSHGFLYRIKKIYSSISNIAIVANSQQILSFFIMDLMILSLQKFSTVNVTTKVIL